MECNAAVSRVAGQAQDQAQPAAVITDGLPRPDRPPGWLLQAFSSPDQLADAVAQALLHRQLHQPLRPLGLATGRTMVPIYATLAEGVRRLTLEQRQQLRRDWLSFNLDEYVGIEAGDPRSFHAAMATRLTAQLGLDPARVHLPDGLAPDPEREAGRYAAAVAAAGGIGLQLLGLGLNGHVGFNEPPCGPQATCRCVQLSEATRSQNAGAFGRVAAAVPLRAITLGLAEILAAERILLVVTGAAKAPVLRRLLEEPATPELPASWLQFHPDVSVFADTAALGRL